MKPYAKFLTGGQILDRMQQNIATTLDSIVGNVNLRNLVTMQSYAATFPSGAATIGEVVWNTAPGGYVGWVCVLSGNPGTWCPFGQAINSVSVGIATGTKTTLTASQALFGYLIFTGSLSGNVTVVFPATVGQTWIVDATAVTLGGHTITLQANGNNWGTSPGTTNLYEVTYGGAGKLYGVAISP